MSEPHWDVAIAGGGPAGCSAAINLASRGLRVVLFESKTYPHHKMCGEFLSPECERLLAGLGLEDRLAALQPVPIYTVSITAPDGEAWESPLPGRALGVSRKVLDAALAERAKEAGVVVREAETVNAIAGSLEKGFSLEVTGLSSSRTVSSRAVIAAHGKRGALDRALERPFLKLRQPFIAIKAHFHGPPIPGRMELHTFPGGYCGMSEIENGAKVVCLLADEQVFQKQRGQGAGSLDQFMEWVKAQNIYLRSWMQWSERIEERWISIAQVPFSRKNIIERDVLMAGDAAGLIVPLAGNGISMALEGGALSAAYLAGYLSCRVSARELRRAYPAAWNRRFRGRLRLGRALQPLVLQPRIASLALRWLNRFPSVGRFLISHTRSR